VERSKNLGRVSYNELGWLLTWENFIADGAHVVILAMIDVCFSFVFQSFCHFFESSVLRHAESLILALELKRDARLAFLPKLFVQLVKPLHQNLVSRESPKRHSLIRRRHQTPLMCYYFNCLLC